MFRECGFFSSIEPHKDRFKSHFSQGVQVTIPRIEGDRINWISIPVPKERHHFLEHSDGRVYSVPVC